MVLLERHLQERYDLLIRLEAERAAGVTGLGPASAEPPRPPLRTETSALDAATFPRPPAAVTPPTAPPVTRRCFWCGKELPKNAKDNQKFCSNGNVCKMAYHRNPNRRNAKFTAWWETWTADRD